MGTRLFLAGARLFMSAIIQVDTQKMARDQPKLSCCKFPSSY